MPTFELFSAYLIAIVLLTITPGVDTLLVVRNSVRSGVRAGSVTSLGICSGLFIHATLSAVGISLILVQTAWAFTLLKWAGACYLLWLGLASLRLACARSGNAGPGITPARVPPRFVRDFREGLLSNLLNPKTALFYMAFLPQFIDPAGNVFLQSMGLAAIHFLLAMVWQCALAAMVAHSHTLASPAWLKRALHGVTGGLFVGIGAKVALSQG
ncbi:LysE family translocator [Marinobacter sp. SS21]|uniref:LysE family translocator n=1 Tax=Marinobacter sp. SS21 TaxID=2979460 RepID=UPI00232E3148|nr:LysE family translocator [Marinobacter sp. SS21]MDC0663746.1 LysE family translocator [Marinobacter sp. SS21]